MDIRKQELDLFEKIRKGDREAFNSLFNLYYSRLCSFSNHMLHDYAKAEEVVADVFFNLWKSKEVLNIHSNLGAYLFKSVRRGSLAEKLKVGQAMEDLAAAEDTQDGMPTAVELLDLQDLQNKLHQIISLLPPRCKQIFVLSRFEGLKYAEISEVMGVSEKTVENQLVKALKLIRAHLLAPKLSS